jgi:hypothetical protein
VLDWLLSETVRPSRAVDHLRERRCLTHTVTVADDAERSASSRISGRLTSHTHGVKIPSLGCPERKTLVVLGAGATRGASFVEGQRVPPPLDRDFFRTLQMSRTGRSSAGRDLLEHVRHVYGPALDIGMETVFTNLDAARTFHRELKVDPGPRVQRPTQLIAAFNEVLPGLLGETADEDCTYHADLARSLRTVDAVISLNYDCLIDTALRAYAGNRFSAERGGYGVPVASGAGAWGGRSPGKTPDGSIRLLKLHGSLNWRSAEKPLRLRDDGELFRPVADGVIQPPLTQKPVSREPLRSIWQEARRVARGTKRLLIVGYSLPDADGLVRTLLTTDLQHDLAEVIVVEPTSDVQSRHIDLFARGAAKAKVFVFRTFYDFSAALSDS